LQLRKKAIEVGRDYIPVTVYGVPPDPKVLNDLAEAGVDRALIQLPTNPYEESIRQLHQFAELMNHQDS
jgi:methylmalonyl-CoA mutase cobalamin-binding subunit